MKSSMFEAQMKKQNKWEEFMCHDWWVFDVASTNRRPNYKRMMRFIMRGPSLGSVCSQGTKTLTYIYSLSKELGYICTQSVSCRLAHTRSWGLWPVVHHMALRQTQSGVMTSEQATVRSHVTDSPHVLPSQEHHGKMTNSCRALAPQRLQKL